MTESRPLPAFAALGGAVAIGAMTAAQARINGVLGVRIDDGIVAGFISFFVGLVAILIVTPFLPSARAGVARLASGIRARSIPFWMLLGGCCGALTVSTQGLVAGVLGVSLFTVGVVAGQTLHGLLLDRIGFGPAGVVAVTPGRLIGGLLALAAVGISLSGDVLSSAPLWLLLLPFLTGAGIAWQAGANGRLAQRTGSPLAATLMSFLAGTIVLVLAASTSVAVRGMPERLPSDPWLYLGGFLGFAYILLGAFLVAHTGVLLMGLGSVLGQLTTSVVIDLLWPATGGPALWQLLAMVVVAAASVLVALPRRRRA
ncbi:MULTISPECIES: DMT family transporter [Microbacterium]|uniref:DMT family transporter n=1 Tax=Microbacterium TaxID=33882 RepID=UPI00217D6BD4|nr:MULTISPECIES: DMT family transporter [Microbacterium]UWF77053.1 DMT family transporter [Microbacterium neungamense]WCM55212.1 DMT family transporter [Microbacterium sp. EF45047]